MSIITYNGESKVIKRICEILDTMSVINFEVVQTLPLVDISTSTIYLVPKQTAQTENIYDEYINTDGTSQGWELIGTTEIDLSNYYTKTEVDNLIPDELSDLQDDSTHRLVTDTEKSTWSGKAKLEDIDKAETGTWNLVHEPFYDHNRTSNQLTFEVNQNGSVTVNGTASANTNYRFKATASNWTLPKGRYRLTGCPSGGSNQTYRLRANRMVGDSTVTYGDDYGNGVEFVVTDDTAYTGIYYILASGSSYTNFILPIPKLIPLNVPTCDKTNAGVYTLQATVDASGNITYSWV